MYSIQRYKDETNERIAKLEQEIATAEKKAENEAKEVKKAEARATLAEEKVEKYKESTKKLRSKLMDQNHGTTIGSETSVATPTPEVTIGVTTPGNEFSDGQCYRDHYGNFFSTSYGMEMIIHPNGDGETYDIVIQDTLPGAHGLNCTAATGRWVNDVLTYTNGTRSHSNGGTYEIVATDCNGTIRHTDGGNDLIWSDSMGGTDIGPFTLS